jgi:hypothetical protein
MPCFFCPRKSIRLFPIESCTKLLFLIIHLYLEGYVSTSGYTNPPGSLYYHFPPETIHHLGRFSK